MKFNAVSTKDIELNKSLTALITLPVSFFLKKKYLIYALRTLGR